MSDEQRERRKNNALSDAEIERIKEQILASIYEDIGRSVVKKALWVLGAGILALLTYLGATGKIR